MKQGFRFFACVCISVFVCMLFLSCATIFKGSTETVSFSSDPSSAKVYVNGSYMGTVPLEIELKSNQTYTIEFRKEGYENKTVILNNSVGAGWIILDVLFGLIPVIVDAATGDWYNLDQTHVNAALVEQQD